MKIVYVFVFRKMNTIEIQTSNWYSRPNLVGYCYLQLTILQQSLIYLGDESEFFSEFVTAMKERDRFETKSYGDIFVQQFAGSTFQFTYVRKASGCIQRVEIIHILSEFGWILVTTTAVPYPYEGGGTVLTIDTLGRWRERE